MKVAVVVPAAGRGERMGGAVKKPYLEVAGKPLIVHTLTRLSQVPEVFGIWLVVAPEDVAYCRQAVVERYGVEKVVDVLAGGASRQESVYRGLQATPPDAEIVLVHDGARPCVPREVVERVVWAAAETGAATAALPVKDTLRTADEERWLEDVVEREGLWRIQTPQGFRRALILQAHRWANEQGLDATDDARLMEGIGVRVKGVLGDERNLKVTTADDLFLVEPLLMPPLEIRTGIGYDIHPLVEGRRLVLGGVPIPFEKGLGGHSDADALVHAVCDALLGGAGLGDIGTHFPDSDPQYRDADSMSLLRQVVAWVRERFRLVNVDATVKAQAPRLSPHVPAMRLRLAEALGVEAERVNVKAKTGEEMGPVGRGEAIEAEAVVTLMLQRTS